MGSKKTGLKIELPIKDNNGDNLIIDDLDQDIWDKIKSNIYDTSLKVCNFSIFTSNLITISKYPLVPDVCRYMITKKGSKFTIECCNKSASFIDSNFNDDIALKHTDKPIILLVLESPHKDEYDDNLNPIAPANGKTGLNIKESLADVLTLIESENCFLENKKTYYLIISNPVPYQTSLNYFHKQSIQKKVLKKQPYKELRDKIWSDIWGIQSIKDDFKTRVINYDPDLIINACTKEFSDIITKFIKDNFDNKQIVKTYHPSSWGGFGIEILYEKK